MIVEDLLLRNDRLRSFSCREFIVGSPREKSSTCYGDTKLITKVMIIHRNHHCQVDFRKVRYCWCWPVLKFNHKSGTPTVYSPILGSIGFIKIKLRTKITTLGFLSLIFSTRPSNEFLRARVHYKPKIFSNCKRWELGHRSDNLRERSRIAANIIIIKIALQLIYNMLLSP